MTSIRNILLAGLVLVSGSFIAQAAATDPDVIARQMLMSTIGASAKTLGGMAGGKVAFDAAAAQAARDAMIEASLQIEAKFKTETFDVEQEAKPEVWTNWDDFLVKAKGLTDTATALDVSSVETIGAGMAGVGGACKACHTDYRL